jgi:hypothetical protein
MKYLTLVALLLSMNVLAADKKVAQAGKQKVDMSQLGKIDQKTLDVAPAKKSTEDVDLMTEKHDMKVVVNCKTADGREIKQGEAGYDLCLQEVKSKKKADGANVEMKFGN